MREVSVAGIITTVAGSGTLSFAGSFAGDGGAATAASLARPVGVSVDSAGTLYIADTNNQRIRQVTAGTIGTVAGSGDQGFADDGAALAGAMLNAPKAALADATGNLLVADTVNQRFRQGLVPTLHFTSQAVGLASAAQTVTLSNTGKAALTISTFNLTGGFTATSGGTCGTLPLTLQSGAGCSATVAYLPVASGAASGSLTVGGSGILPQTVLLAGTSGQGTTMTSLVADASSALAGQPVTFTATVQPGGAGLPDGSVQFYDGSNPLGPTQKLVGKTSSVSIDLATGVHSITAMYSGSANFLASTSPAVAEAVADFNSVLMSASGTSAGASDSTNQTVVPGQPAAYAFLVQPLGGSFNVPVTLSATGFPPGATVSFSPQTVTVGAASAPFTMTVQTSAATADLRPSDSSGYAVLACTFFLPMLALARRKAAPRSIRLCLGLVVAVLATAGLSGCGAGNGYFSQTQKTYTLQITGTATGLSGATLQHVATVQLTLQ
ncbi:MAG: Ig-like domain repeat protein [Janthinobacterium lividum]